MNCTHKTRQRNWSTPRRPTLQLPSHRDVTRLLFSGYWSRNKPTHRTRRCPSGVWFHHLSSHAAGETSQKTFNAVVLAADERRRQRSDRIRLLLHTSQLRGVSGGISAHTAQSQDITNMPLGRYDLSSLRSDRGEARSAPRSRPRRRRARREKKSRHTHKQVCKTTLAQRQLNQP